MGKYIPKCNKEDCKKSAVYHVWYIDVDSTPICGFNIAYNSLCPDCTAEEVKNGRDGYLVACAKRIR